MRFLACGVFAIEKSSLCSSSSNDSGLNEKAAQSQTAAPTRSFPYSQRAGRSTHLVLALGAIEGRTAALNDALDRPAARARLSLPVIDRKALREIAELAIRAGEIAQSRPAGRNRFGKDLTN